MDNSDRLDNQQDGVVADAEDNMDMGAGREDDNDAGYQQDINVTTGIMGGTPNPYKGPGNTTLTPRDPRFT